VTYSEEKRTKEAEEASGKEEREDEAASSRHLSRDGKDNEETFQAKRKDWLPTK
jgi:hypothetical protein